MLDMFKFSGLQHGNRSYASAVNLTLIS